MRFFPLALIAAALPLSACVAEDEAAEDLGSIADGKTDAPAIKDLPVTLSKRFSTGKPGVKLFTVKSTVDFTVSLAYDGDDPTKITVTNQTTGAKFESSQGKQPTVDVTASDTSEKSYLIRLENYSTSTVHAKLSALGKINVSPALLAAAKANLDRITKEIDFQHMQSYGLPGSLTDQFLRALSAEYQTQHPDQYIARVKALASMAFFAMPDVKPPADGNTTPFHGLDMNQFDALASIEDSVFEQLVSDNGGDTNGVRPFSVCETKFIIETYVRPNASFPGFAGYKSAYTTYAASCVQKDKDEWYNFRGLGGLRPSWVESNLADRFLRRMAKNCQSPGSSWASECSAWNQDRFGYRQLRNRQLAARTIYYAPADEAYLINPGNPLVLVEDRNGDGIGEYFRPGPVTLTSGEQGTLNVTSTSEFAGTLKFQPASGAERTIKPSEMVANQSANLAWDRQLLEHPDMGLLSVFSDGANCKSASLDPATCPLMRRFYSMIDRHENFYQTFSALTPDYYGVSSQPSPLVACSITVAAAHQWDTAGTPPGGTAGFIFLMRVPFKDILTGNEKSIATLMPGPATTSLQSLYAGGHLDMSRAWLDVASLSNNQYANEHEISAFGAVPANEIEGILVIRKPAGVQ